MNKFPVLSKNVGKIVRSEAFNFHHFVTTQLIVSVDSVCETMGGRTVRILLFIGLFPSILQ